MSIDIDTARETFASSADLTVGLEEEFALLDPDSHDLVPRFEELFGACQEDELLAASAAGELIASEIEIRSGRGEDLADALDRQRAHRRGLFALAARLGIALGSCGTHPWADYREQTIIDTPHYRRLAEDLQLVARRNNTFSLHVHVGVNGADRAIRACDRLRPVLPILLAISANSPYIDGRDSGLHSARTQAFTRSFPRCGVPDAYGDWATFAAYLDFLVRTNSIVEYTQVWWSIRPHLTFGTVEVRICDGQMTAAESDGLAALMVACVAQALRDEDEGVPFTDPPARAIEENVWRALRYGLDGALIDLDAIAEVPAPLAVERLLAWTEPARSEIGVDPGLPERNGAQRQRARIEAGATMDEVYADAVRATRDSYAEEVIA